jgi:N-methylhydantoinase A/oxoprolinase/acetone carboxylase beta subunit
MEKCGVPVEGTVMLAYGGAGAGHACGIADAIGITEIVTLPFSAVFSAFGASSADVRHAYVEPDTGAEDVLRRRALRDMRGEGFAPDDVDVEVDMIERHGATCTRLTATAHLDHFQFASRSTNGAGTTAASNRTVTWPGHGAQDTPIYHAETLAPGATVQGPAVLEAADTTYAVPPEWSFRVDEHGNGRLTR